MSILIGWASRVFGPRRARRMRRASLNWARRPYGFESLESRRLLAVTATYSAGMLTISVDDASSVTITSSAPGLGGNVLVNGLDPTGGPALTSAITDIQLTATNAFDNLVDLTQVSQVDFSALATVSLDAGDGSDTYQLDQSGLLGAATVSVTDTGTGILDSDSLQLTTSSAGPETIGVSSLAVSRDSGATVGYSGIESLDVSGSIAGDTFNINSTAAGTATTVDGQGDIDSFSVSDLSAIDTAGLTVVGDGDDTLTVQTAAGGATVTIDSGTVQQGAAGDVDYSGLDTLIVNGTAGADTFNVSSTETSTATTINADDGKDTFGDIDLTSIGAAGLTIDADGGAMEELVLNVTTAETVDVSNTTVQRNTNGAVDYTGFEKLTVNGSVGADTFDIESTAAGAMTMIFGAGDVDVFNVNDLSAIGSPGPLGIDGGGDGDMLVAQAGAPVEGTVFVGSMILMQGVHGMVVYTGFADLQINGTSAADTFMIGSTNAGTATSVDGGDGGDTYNVVQSALGGALTIGDTGGSGTDTISSTTTFAGPETITITSATITRSGGEPDINYTGIEALSVSGTAGVDTFTVTSTPGATSLDGLGGGDTYNVVQSALGGTLTIADTGGSGTDLISSTTTFAGPETITITSAAITRTGGEPDINYTGIEALSVSGTAGVDTFTVTSTPGATSLDGLGSGDTYNVVQSALVGTLTISDTGGSGTDTITSTTTFAGPETITITSAAITRTGGEPDINYTGIEALSVSGTAGVDTFTVTSTPGATSLDGLGSGDTYNVVQSALGGALTITDTGGSGTDTITSTTTFAGPETITITSSAITRSGGEADINYTGIEALSVSGTAGGDIVNVVSTPGDTTVNAGAGNDTVNVGNAGSLSSIVGALTIHGDGNSGTPTNTLTSGGVSNTLPVGDTVHFDDSAAAGAINYTLGTGSLARTGIATITFDTFETIILDAGTDGNMIDVTGTLASVNVTVNGGTGNDTITLVSNGATSNVVLNGGADSDTLTIQSVAAGSVVIANGNSEVDTFTPIDLTTIAATAGLTVDADGGAGELLTLNVVTNGTVSVSSTTVQRSGNGAVTYADFENLVINGTALVDTFNVASTAAATATTINAAGDVDLFGPIALTTIGLAGLTIDADGGAGEALTLEIASAGTVTLTSTTAQRSGDGLLTYTDFELLTLNGTAGVELVNVLSTIATTAYILNGGGSNDVITLGNVGTLSGILGIVTVHGDAHSAAPTNTLNSGSVSNTLPVGDTLRLDDSAAGGAINYTLNPGTFTRSGAATVTFDTVETITLDAGTNGNVINVTSTAASVNVTVNGGAGVDTITLAGTGATSNVVLNGGANNDILNIQAISAGSVVLANGNADNDTINVASDAPTNAGTLNGILGGLRIDAGTGTDKLILSDFAAAVANSAVEVRNNRINGFAGPANAAQVDYLFGGTLELTLIGSNTLNDKFRVILPSLAGLTMRFDGAGGTDDALRIDGTAGNDVVPVGIFGSGQAFQVQNIECLKLFGGAGSDTITNSTAVSSLIDGGAGDDILSGGSLTDVIFGGDGIDQLFGNAGNDFLFADHNYNNGSPTAGPTRNGDQVFGGTGVDTIVSLGSDSISAGGDVGDTIIGKGFRITVIDWLKARFLKPVGKNVQNAINQAMAQHCAQP